MLKLRIRQRRGVIEEFGRTLPVCVFSPLRIKVTCHTTIVFVAVEAFGKGKSAGSGANTPH
jgi:hypothetical protein